ncbi:hypothetical protein C8A03DRAFT_31381 [Achaetomium macrosporum]|uniref:Uncharacterized protein n=1 Tax=Achaetomium macrosporum TaxID=79813 RepID=A0AAN7CEG5_9PEZI|nr:hypothetical protein C8A03DRAFT_31381 [Achaetomium macrosporum]
MSRQGAGSAGSAGSAARPAKASTSTPAQQHDDRDLDYEREQLRKEARMEAHWLKWLPQADKESTVVLVFDKSPDTIAADIKAMVGANTKITTVPRVPGTYENIEEGKNLGTVQAGLVTMGVYGDIRDKYELKSITVKFDNQERMAFIPVGARKQ